MSSDGRGPRRWVRPTWHCVETASLPCGNFCPRKHYDLTDLVLRRSRTLWGGAHPVGRGTPRVCLHASPGPSLTPAVKVSRHAASVPWREAPRAGVLSPPRELVLVPFLSPLSPLSPAVWASRIVPCPSCPVFPWTCETPRLHSRFHCLTFQIRSNPHSTVMSIDFKLIWCKINIGISMKFAVFWAREKTWFVLI